ncbi:MAG: D-alanine--D-alanine ligase, partial [Erysipelotrichales bacterium]
KTDYFANETEILDRLEKNVGYPMIIKPASLGSSVGISKAETREKLKQSIDEAARYDIKIIVEKAIENLIEVNCAVLGDYSEQRTSAIERVFQSDEILSYKDKYQSSGSKGTKGSKDKGMAATQREIPAEIPLELDEQIREMGINGFKALNLAGNVRIDFLINKTDNSVYLNEVNTIPGSLAFYLWSEVGLGFDELCEELIKIAIKRKREQGQFTTSFDTNVLQNMGTGTKGTKK